METETKQITQTELLESLKEVKALIAKNTVIQPTYGHPYCNEVNAKALIPVLEEMLKTGKSPTFDVKALCVTAQTIQLQITQGWLYLARLSPVWRELRTRYMVKHKDGLVFIKPRNVAVMFKALKTDEEQMTEKLTKDLPELLERVANFYNNAGTGDVMFEKNLTLTEAMMDVLKAQLEEMLGTNGNTFRWQVLTTEVKIQKL